MSDQSQRRQERFVLGPMVLISLHTTVVGDGSLAH